MIPKESKIYIAGHNGMVGSAIHRKLTSEGYSNFILKTTRELDLRNQLAVNDFFESERPDYVFLAAAKVGGIQANNIYRGAFIYDNLMIQSNVIHAAYVQKVKKLLFLGSSCIYPKMAVQPIKEGYLLTGKLEPTNEPYAIAKIAGIKLCEAYRDEYNCNFISVMPTNLYGPNDNYDLENSHVLPALIRRFHTAKIKDEASVTIWGTGKPRREFMHVDDLAAACYFVMSEYDEKEIVNIGSGDEVSILELANIIKEVVGYQGTINHDLSKPDGTARKFLDISKLNNLGWKAKIPLTNGIKNLYSTLNTEDWY